jgi:uncharacterized DUF497 family protein
MHLLWNGNIEHIAEHGLSQDDVQYVFDNPSGYGVSRTSGEDVVFGYTPDGRYVACVFQSVDDATACPITAFDVPEPER